MPNTEFVIVLITASSSEEAERLAEALVVERLAACINVVGAVRSIYRWQGRIERADEVLMIAKAKRTDFEALSARVHELHSYSTPEIVALPLEAIAERYLAWLRE